MTVNFQKTIGPDFRRVEVSASDRSEWLNITMTFNNINEESEKVRMTFLTTEDVRDLHYALTRYLQKLDGVTKC